MAICHLASLLALNASKVRDAGDVIAAGLRVQTDSRGPLPRFMRFLSGSGKPTIPTHVRVLTDITLPLATTTPRCDTSDPRPWLSAMQL